MIAWSRGCVFYVGYATITVVWGTLSLLVAWALPYRKRFLFIIGCWTRAVLWWLHVSCGIRHEVDGLENLPSTPCVVLAKHASTWETLFLQTVFTPQATAIKRELLNIPFFGWAFRLLKPIALDRGQPVAAMRQLIDIGTRRLDAGIWVVLLPEGTRVPGMQVGRFYRGGGALAVAAKRPVVVVAHNAARYWPPHRMAKHAGVIRVAISTPISVVDGDADAVTAAARNWMVDAMGRLESSTRSSTS